MCLEVSKGDACVLGLFDDILATICLTVENVTSAMTLAISDTIFFVTLSSFLSFTISLNFCFLAHVCPRIMLHIDKKNACLQGRRRPRKKKKKKRPTATASNPLSEPLLPPETEQTVEDVDRSVLVEEGKQRTEDNGDTEGKESIVDRVNSVHAMEEDDVPTADV